MQCKNCKTSINTNQRYCAECGAKIIKNRLTLKHLSKSLSEEFLSYDNRFLKTFRDLFTKPETVINEYIDGTRKKHVGVVQYFAISLTLAGIQLFLTNMLLDNAIEADMSFMDDFLKNTNDPKSKAIIQSYMDSMNFIKNYQNLIYIFSVPVGAISTWLAYHITSNKRYNFTEHIVINMYYSAQLLISMFIIILLSSIFKLNFMVFYGFIMVISMVYYFYIFKRVFASSFWMTFANMVLVGIIYSIWFTLLFGSVIVVLTLLNSNA
ncbi:DUF3667 domain-containing protein [Winogradskyella sp. 3972H.M.0a.05]|uniref:DUF3667 domain-containing protein n=1 Tax=Winogradskyella sp. 3972H.M.0a.05 TaxID=2950277 RepID=UPI003396310D